MNQNIAIYGSGGFGREVACLLNREFPESKVIFIEDDPELFGTFVNGIIVYPSHTINDHKNDFHLFIAVSNPKIRERIAKNNLGLINICEPIISKHSTVGSFTTIGLGTVVMPFNYTTVNSTIGEHVHINYHTVIGHDVVIGDFSTISPKVAILGNVVIEHSCFLGAGAIIRNGNHSKKVIVRKNSTIAAGALVLNDTEENSLMLGIPAVNKASNLTKGSP